MDPDKDSDLDGRILEAKSKEEFPVHAFLIFFLVPFVSICVPASVPSTNTAPSSTGA